MRRIFLSVMITTLLLIVSGFLLSFSGPAAVFADSDPVGELVTKILAEDHGGEKIKAMVLDFRVSFVEPEKKPSEEELKNISSRFTEEFITDLMQKINSAGKQDRVAVIDSSRLNDILREKKLPVVTGADNRSATDLGSLAGVDVIIAGSVQVSGKASATIVKAVRVKDGEIISIIKQGGVVQAERGTFSPITVIDEEQKIAIGTWKALPVKLSHSGTLHVTLDVVKGNSIDVVVIAEPELERLKKNEAFTSQPEFTAGKAKRYQRKAAIEKGNYYLVLRDSSVGVFSVSESTVKVTARLEP